MNGAIQVIQVPGCYIILCIFRSQGCMKQFVKSALFVSMERDLAQERPEVRKEHLKDSAVQASSDDEEGTLQDLFVTLLLSVGFNIQLQRSDAFYLFAADRRATARTMETLSHAATSQKKIHGNFKKAPYNSCEFSM